MVKMMSGAAFLLAAVLTLLAGVSSSVIAASCPQFCECGRNSNNIYTAKCTKILPEGISFAEVKLLTVNPVISVDGFPTLDYIPSVFPKLKYLQLPNCGLSHLSHSRFKQLGALREVNLSNNRLRTFSTHLFFSNHKLLYVNLEKNPLKLTGKPILVSKSIIELDISHCNLTDIPVNTFSGLPNLKYLRLEHNEITTVYTNSLPTSVRVLSLSHNRLINVPIQELLGLEKLQEVDLSENPINCTCELMGYQNWISGQGVIFLNNIVCSLPINYTGWKLINIPQYNICEATVISNSNSGESCGDDRICDNVILPIAIDNIGGSYHRYQKGRQSLDGKKIGSLLDEGPDAIYENDEMLPVSKKSNKRDSEKQHNADDNNAEGSGDYEEEENSTTDDKQTEPTRGPTVNQNDRQVSLDSSSQTASETTPPLLKEESPVSNQTAIEPPTDDSTKGQPPQKIAPELNKEATLATVSTTQVDSSSAINGSDNTNSQQEPASQIESVAANSSTSDESKTRFKDDEPVLDTTKTDIADVKDVINPTTNAIEATAESTDETTLGNIPVNGTLEASSTEHLDIAAKSSEDDSSNTKTNTSEVPVIAVKDEEEASSINPIVLNTEVPMDKETTTNSSIPIVTNSSEGTVLKSSFSSEETTAKSNDNSSSEYKVATISEQSTTENSTQAGVVESTDDLETKFKDEEKTESPVKIDIPVKKDETIGEEEESTFIVPVLVDVVPTNETINETDHRNITRELETMGQPHTGNPEELNVFGYGLTYIIPCVVVVVFVIVCAVVYSSQRRKSFRKNWSLEENRPNEGTELQDVSLLSDSAKGNIVKRSSTKYPNETESEQTVRLMGDQNEAASPAAAPSSSKSVWERGDTSLGNGTNAQITNSAERLNLEQPPASCEPDYVFSNGQSSPKGSPKGAGDDNEVYCTKVKVTIIPDSIPRTAIIINKNSMTDDNQK